MAVTSLFAVRAALHDAIAAQLAGVGVDLLEAPPKDAEELSEREACWWVNETSVSAEPYTMPTGLVETYTLTVTVQTLPADGDVTPADAHAAGLALADLVFTAVRANRRPLNPDVDGWDAVCEWAGFEHAAARLEQPAGYATRFELRISVEATRCS